MDGASKFVRGDAIAGLLIVFINVIGGMIIGIAQQGLSFSQAAEFYTKLTVGDGLVTQIPALIVSTAAGLLVTKAGLTEATDKALFSQLTGYPKALGMSSLPARLHGALARHADAALPGARAADRRRPPAGAQGARPRRRRGARRHQGRRPRRRWPRNRSRPRCASTMCASNSAMACCR